MEPAKAGPHLLGTAFQDRQRHQALRLQQRETAKFTDEVVRLLRRDAVFALFAGGVDLHEDIERSPSRGQALMQQRRQPQAVERLELRGEGDHRLRLVGLEMTDHAPAHAEPGQRVGLALHLLDLVLAERGHADADGKPDDLDRHGLADRKQSDRRACPPRPGAGHRNPLLHGSEVVAQRPLRILAEAGRDLRVQIASLIHRFPSPTRRDAPRHFSTKARSTT